MRGIIIKADYPFDGHNFFAHEGEISTLEDLTGFWVWATSCYGCLYDFTGYEPEWLVSSAKKTFNQYTPLRKKETASSGPEFYYKEDNGICVDCVVSTDEILFSLSVPTPNRHIKLKGLICK